MSCSTRSAASASSRWRTNCQSSRKTTIPPTVTFSAIIVASNQAGRIDRPPPASSPTRPEARKTPTKAANQRNPARAPPNTRAPSGARMPHRPTAPDATKPPTNAIEIVGARRMLTSSTRTSHAVSRVRAKIAIAPTDTAR